MAASDITHWTGTAAGTLRRELNAKPMKDADAQANEEGSDNKHKDHKQCDKHRYFDVRAHGTMSDRVAGSKYAARALRKAVRSLNFSIEQRLPLVRESEIARHSRLQRVEFGLHTRDAVDGFQVVKTC